MRPPLHIVGTRLRCLVDPRSDDQRRSYSSIEWRMSAMRMWLSVQQQAKAECGNVTPLKGRK